MLTVKPAKSKLERQEGMNHLWISYQPSMGATNVRIVLELPAGVYRSRNLNGFHENEADEIVVYEPGKADGFFIEIFTREAIDCGMKTIRAVLLLEDRHGTQHRLEQTVSLEVADEEDMDDVRIDDELIRRLKDLPPPGDGDERRDEDGKHRFIRLAPGPFSDLEKKYRIEG
ncbi:hypothetical protein [Paenibacillus arenilitoris]|uniref:Uncharacterized protein n=1 Tax=Paenibacillus arenilitoris TaxID=2772299 RepID=A0A927CJ79_9BACL|nr:hypothetical protein [Paenibacillus arenilitoris]MBD2867186.1 hypothetical protein [Paenibacillus arenilitoris]